MLGSHIRYPAVVLLAVAVVLQTGTTSLVKAINLSAKLTVGQHPQESATALEVETAETI
jgi:hypothetical protein